MEKLVDNLLEKLFGNIGLQINIIASIVLLVAGLVVLVFSKKNGSKRQKTIALILVGVGCVGLLKGVIWLML
ncbi:hypothetical protein [Candidatus Southlakia epibionticum]|uniref:LPXTG cell wall anchor domain-containing protein n=1 Tax=Candidatus Southlakia epibionticum TaxID=3043284 RepID=A0ABY8WY48_9BACT|nr:hypothetical protein SEML1_0834 [Candidatus Saccharimonadaceae bacterium ML1]